MTKKKDFQKIAFFDSGVGGITVLYEALKYLPHEHFLYFADCANSPYGNKADHEIIDFTLTAVNRLMEHPLKALVLACNTATSLCIPILREKYTFPIIGMEPAVKAALKNDIKKKILVLATSVTLGEQKFQNLLIDLNSTSQVTCLALQKLVDFAENFQFHHPDLMNYLYNNLKNIDWSEYHSVVLGCTHFSYFYLQLRRFIPANIDILDGNVGTVKHLSTLIQPECEGPHSLDCILSGMEVSSELILPYLNYLRDSEDQRFIT